MKVVDKKEDGNTSNVTFASNFINLEKQLKANLNTYTSILFLQTLIIFFTWYFGIEQTSELIYNVNYRVFDMFFALCIRLFICLFTYYFIVTSGTHPRYRKNMIALNYWLSCTYLILGISKIVLLIGSSYNHGDKFVRFIVAIITIIPSYFEIKYSNSMYSIIIEIFENVGKKKKNDIDIEDPRNRYYNGPKNKNKKKLSIFSMFKILKPYFLPKGCNNKIRAASTFFVLISSKACNIISPIYIGLAVSKNK